MLILNCSEKQKHSMLLSGVFKPKLNKMNVVCIHQTPNMTLQKPPYLCSPPAILWQLIPLNTKLSGNNANCGNSGEESVSHLPLF